MERGGIRIGSKTPRCQAPHFTLISIKPNQLRADMHDLYFEDFYVGLSFTTKSKTLSEAEILAFAWEHDPQPFHIDKPTAQASIFGSLIAPGTQTMAITWRLIYGTGLIDSASLGSPGLDEVRWLAPVRPGDTLHVKSKVLEVRASRSKPDRGIVKLENLTINQDGTVVQSYTSLQLMKKKSTNDAAP